MKRRRKTPSTPLGDKLRAFAASYLASGQKERAEGLVQAADTVDLELARAPREGGGVDVAGLVDAMMQRLEERLAELVARRSSSPPAPATVIRQRRTKLARLIETAPPTAPKPRPPPTSTARPAHAIAHSDEDLGKGERKTLAAIAQYGAQGLSVEGLTVITGYKRSSRNTYLGRLKARGLVRAGGAGLVVTDAGLVELGPDFARLPSGAALLEQCLEELPEGESLVLQFVTRVYPAAVDRERIDESTGYKRSSRNTYIHRLRARQLVEIQPDGHVRASDWLFDRPKAMGGSE